MIHPTDPPDALRRPGRAPVIAALLTALEALVLLAFAGFYVYEIVVGAADSLTTALTSAALILVFGIALLFMARGWARGQGWPRTPTLVWNALLLPVAWSLHESDQTVIGVAVAVLAVAGIAAALASPPSHRVQDEPEQDEPEQGDRA